MKANQFAVWLKRFERDQPKLSQSKDWSNFVGQLTAQFEEHEQEEIKLRRLTELSFDEMQKWWMAVEQRQAIIKAVIDVSSDSIMTLDRDGKIVEFNHVSEVLFGKSKQEVLGVPILDLIAPCPFRDELVRQFANLDAFKDNQALAGEKMNFEIFATDGRQFSAEVAINAIRTGTEIAYPIFIRDLTEQIKDQQNLEATQAQANQSAKMASLGEMAGGIAHEINTPLNVFTMCAEMLRESAQDQTVNQADVVDAANTIEETALRISKIIHGLKVFSRDDSQDDHVLCSISSVVTDTLSLCKQKFTGRGVQLRFQDIRGDWLVIGRPTSLSQVLLNLLNNALDAIETLPELWIELDVSETETQYVLSVTDSGHGIDAKTVKRLMEPFFTTKPIGKGTGLGLSLSKGIVESHGGTLVYDSTSKNTKFTISLPKATINKLVA